MQRLLAAVLVVLAVFDAPRAEACSVPWIKIERVAPASGSVGVPTNVQVRVYRLDVQPDQQATKDLFLRPLGSDAAVPGTVTVEHNAGIGWRYVVILTPDRALAASTTYELVGKADGATYGVMGSFSTGTGPDTTPPSFAGIASVGGGTPFRCSSSIACCGDHFGFNFNPSWADATDDSGIAGYVIERDGKKVSVNAGTGFAMCGGTYGGDPRVGFFSGPGTYSVHAIDLAGNVDENAVALPLAVDCASFDAVTPPQEPAPQEPAPQEPAPPSMGGSELLDEVDHGCSVGGRGNAPAALLVAGAIIVIRRRRRAP